MSERRIVVGGGAVGLGCALFLQADGFAVTLIDRAEPGQGTSFGNAGILSVQSVRPSNTPEILAKLPTLLAGERSPVRIRWPDLAATAPWLAAFARNCTAARSAASARGQAALCRAAGDAWRVLLQRCGGNERVRWCGWLKLAEDAAEARGLAVERDLVAAEGQPFAWLDGDDVAALEPALGPRFQACLWLQANGQVDRPGEVLREFAARFAADGGRIVRDEARDIAASAGGVVVRGAGRDYAGEQAVLAAGPWAADLARRLGSRVPLVAERGYHLMLPPGADTDRAPALRGAARLRFGADGRRAAAQRRRRDRAHRHARRRAGDPAARGRGEAAAAGNCHGRCGELDGPAPLDAGQAAGDRPLAAPRTGRARLRSRPSRSHPGADHRPPRRRPGGGPLAPARPHPLSCAAVIGGTFQKSPLRPRERRAYKPLLVAGRPRFAVRST